MNKLNSSIVTLAFFFNASVPNQMNTTESFILPTNFQPSSIYGKERITNQAITTTIRLENSYNNHGSSLSETIDNKTRNISIDAVINKPQIEYTQDSILSGGVNLDKSKMINELAKIWAHMNEDQIKYLNSAPIGMIEDLHTLFFYKKTLQSKVDDMDLINFDRNNLNRLDVEDFVLELDHAAVLLFRVSTVFVDKEIEGAIYKEISLIDPSYSLVIPNYSDDKYQQFQKFLNEVFWKNTFDSDDMGEL
jgi:hypothetical protein